MRFVHNHATHGFSDLLSERRHAQHTAGTLAAGNENCCLQEVKAKCSHLNAPPKPVDIFVDDETLKEQEAAARAAKAQREKERKQGA